ncbi:Wadjet anti-phage system protein JetD domain-containing protein [Candidatus Nitrospira bockiana]
MLETEAINAEALPLVNDTGRAVSLALLRRIRAVPGAQERALIIPTRGVLGELAARGIPASSVDEWLERLMRCGLARLVWKLQGTRRSIKALHPLNVEALEEFAAPGKKAERQRVLHEARETVSALTHPVAREVARILADEEPERLPAKQIRALAAVAKHVQTGEVLAARVFAARYLGHSKSLDSVRKFLEGWLGPLETLGIREGAAMALLGGTGSLFLDDQKLNVALLPPFVGLGADTLQATSHVEFPANGLFVVENLTPFEACCRGEVAAAKKSLVLWAGGYPSRAIRTMVTIAAQQRVRVRVWCDIDLDGVRIARVISSWLPADVEPFHMSSEDLAHAPEGQILSSRAVAAIKADLAAQPHALLAETLRALLSRNLWVEQEALLATNELREEVSRWEARNARAAETATVPSPGGTVSRGSED